MRFDLQPKNEHNRSVYFHEGLQNGRGLFHQVPDDEEDSYASSSSCKLASISQLRGRVVLEYTGVKKAGPMDLLAVVCSQRRGRTSPMKVVLDQGCFVAPS